MYAAVLATTPRVAAPCSARFPTRLQVSRSASLLRTTCAHFSPGRFQAFEAEVAVSVCPAVTGDSDAYGTCRWPGNTSGAWISSENTRPPCRSTTAAIASISPAVRTRPTGLCGLQRISRPAPAANAASSAPRSYRPPGAGGTWTTRRPSAGGTVRNGMYAGVGSTTGVPGALKCSIAIVSAATTSATGRTSAGSTAQPYRSRLQAAYARDISAAVAAGR